VSLRQPHPVLAVALLAASLGVALTLTLACARSPDRLPALGDSWLVEGAPPLDDAALAGDPLPPNTLRELAARTSTADLVELRPLAGQPLVSVDIAGEPTPLPAGLGPRIAAVLGTADAGTAFATALDTAATAIRDPRGELPEGLADAWRDRIAAGLRAELISWGPRLTAGTHLGHRDRVLIAGLGRDAAWHLPDALAPHAESQTYAAWLDALAAWYADHDIPAHRLDLGLPAGPVDVRRLLLEPTPDPDPLAAVGRLLAAQLLARADLVEVIFAGHGRLVADPNADADRFGPYTSVPLQAGDECQELAILRTQRGGPALRLGFCLGADAPLVALSCSAASDTRAGPQHGTATVGWFLDSGAWPSFDRIEPIGFRLFPLLQQRLLAASDPDDLGDAVKTTLQDARARATPSTALTGLSRLDDGAWRLRVGGSGVPDVILLDADVDRISPTLDRRIDRATASWRVVRAVPDHLGGPELVETIDVCGPHLECVPTLSQLDAFEGPLPTTAFHPLVVQLDGHTAHLAHAPDRDNPWVRLAIVQGDDEADAATLDRAERLASGLHSRRVQGLLLVRTGSR